MLTDIDRTLLAELDDAEPLPGEWVIDPASDIETTAIWVVSVLLTAELFVGKIEVDIESDPEIADCNYAVFHVTTNSDRGELPALRREWYHRTVKLLKNDCDKVRLVISVEE